jgi:hypothetical protein
VLRTASVTGIPAAAIAAYQRAETVINAADPACHLPWELVAAIGRVESDHGRYGGNVLDDDGVARPGIYGMRLDGTRGTARISDSDAGELDHDMRFDRAVGPMQFIPSTWRVVGVDADGDGDRNPQDIDDAALGTAVYLCAGTDDLATDAGRRASVFRYNHSQDYVDLVLAIMAAYQQGQFTSVPNGITTTTVLVPDVTYQGPDDGNGDGQGNQPGDGDGTPQVGDPVDDPTDTTGDPSDDPSDDPTQDPTLDPTLGPDDPTDDPTSLPTQLPTELPTELPTDVTSTADDVLTEAEALAQCLADGVVDDPLTAVNELTECVTDLLDG